MTFSVIQDIGTDHQATISVAYKPEWASYNNLSFVKITHNSDDNLETYEELSNTTQQVKVSVCPYLAF